MDPIPSKHFVLVHGACHGAWCWYKLLPLLKSAGHRVTALELAASGVDPRQAMDLQSVSDYFQPLTDFMAALPADEKVILVGHSFGGQAVALAMEMFPGRVSVAVFVNANVPGPDLDVTAIRNEFSKRRGPQLDSIYTYDNGPNEPPTTFTFGPLYLSSRLYQLSPIEDSTLASLLVRPLRLFSSEDMAKVIIATRENFGSVKKICIISEDDLVIPKDFQLWMVERNPMDEVRDMQGSDHMMMISKPNQLSDHLLDIAAKYH